LSPVCGQCRRRFRFTAAVSLPPGMPEGVAAPFRSLPQAGACTPLGDNLSPVCCQCRKRFRFTATVPLPPGCRKGPPPLPLSSAGGGVYPARKQFVPRQWSMPTALPIHRHRPSSSGDAGGGRHPFRFTATVPLPPGMPEGAAAPSAFFRRRGRVPRRGNNLSPVCGQCQQRFRFIAAVPLPLGMPEGAAAPSAFFHSRGLYPAEERFSES